MHDVLGIDPRRELRGQSAPGQPRQALGIALKDRLRGRFVAGLKLPQQFGGFGRRIDWRAHEWTPRKSRLRVAVVRIRKFAVRWTPPICMHSWEDRSPSRRHTMAHVVTSPCFGCKYTDCVVVCPVDAFREGEQMLYIEPGRVHRLRRVRAGMPGGSDFLRGQCSRRGPAVHRAQCPDVQAFANHL